MLPPRDVEPSALFLKLKETPAPSEVVDFPRRGSDGRPLFQVRIMVLEMPHHHEARLRGQSWLKERGIDRDQQDGEAVREVLGDRIAQELLAMACHEVSPIEGSEATGAPRYKRIFATADDVGVLTASELSSLFVAYSMVQEKYGPYPGNLTTDAEVSAWIKRLTEGASQLPLSLLNSHRLAELTMSLARRAYTLSEALESQYSTLPDTLASSLKPLAIGMSYFGKRPADTAPDGSASDELGTLGLPDDGPIDIDEAIRIAARLQG